MSRTIPSRLDESVDDAGSAGVERSEPVGMWPSRTILVHEGWACSRGSLLTASGRRWVAAIRLHLGARIQMQAMLTVMVSLSQQIDLIDCELRRTAKSDERLKALQRIFGVGPILAATILAEIGDAKRFRRAR